MEYKLMSNFVTCIFINIFSRYRKKLNSELVMMKPSNLPQVLVQSRVLFGTHNMKYCA